MVHFPLNFTDPETDEPAVVVTSTELAMLIRAGAVTLSTPATRVDVLTLLGNYYSQPQADGQGPKQPPIDRLIYPPEGS